MQAKAKYIPDSIEKRYDINKIVINNGQVHIKIQKGILGLRQAATLAYKYLKDSLEFYRYTHILGTVSLQQHNKSSTKFCLYINDFGIKYWSKVDA